MDLELEFAGDQPSRESAAMRFLIIDDSVTMRRIIANILNRLGYAEVVHAANGREALDRLGADTVDVIITDWYMPEMNGLDFVTALRSTPATKHIPIVIVTANAASDDIQRAMDLGVNSYVLKPFTAETMRDKIGVVLAQAAALRAAAAETPADAIEPTLVDEPDAVAAVAEITNNAEPEEAPVAEEEQAGVGV